LIVDLSKYAKEKQMVLPLQCGISEIEICVNLRVHYTIFPVLSTGVDPVPDHAILFDASRDR
jgi:hypothetical protein